jgi:hypothetical protein
VATQHFFTAVSQDLLALFFKGFGNIQHGAFLALIQALFGKSWTLAVSIASANHLAHRIKPCQKIYH